MTVLSLQSVDFLQDNGTPIFGLELVSPKETNDLPIDERAAVLEAEAFEHIDFVYFRRFSDGRSSQVAAYVIDNSDERMEDTDLAKLHWVLWLHGAAPLLYVAGPSRIDVLSCARGPDFWDNDDCRYHPAATISTAAGIDAELDKRRRFSAYRLADGTFWENPRNASLANPDKAAHQALITAVVETDKEIGGKTSPVMRWLLLLMILIKYLEDRRVFPSGWFGKFEKGAKNFFDVLQAGTPDNVVRLLASLERKFNGDIFALPTNGRHKLTKKGLKSFAKLVEAQTLGVQRYLWAQFTFEHLPVEIISHLYQRFVEGGHGAVYTPPFLADLILDHALPYNNLTGQERILDPACGSGVFLVGAFRRLVNAWRGRNEWQRPNVKTLKEILRHSIYGVELDSDAVNLTAFSLALAVCDALKPEVIWKELQFDRLRGRNLSEADFFKLVLEHRNGNNTVLDKGFDIVVGNPPFESKFTEAGEELDLELKNASNNRGTTPDKQAAYLFLEQSLASLRDGGCVCLIQPASFLYNRKVADFRRQLFQHRRTDTILDMTSIRGLFVKDTNRYFPDKAIFESTFYDSF